MNIDTTDYEAMADRAERGEIEIGASIYTGDGSPIALNQHFVTTGRPRMEEVTARRTWKVRAPQTLDDALTATAQREHMPKSALIRKAVATYIDAAALPI